MDAARKAVLHGLEIDETAEVLYRDWMTIEQAAGNATGVHKAIARIERVTRAYNISMTPLTEKTITRLLSTQPAHV